jgi:hypothetical protein
VKLAVALQHSKVADGIKKLVHFAKLDHFEIHFNLNGFPHVLCTKLIPPRNARTLMTIANSLSNLPNLVWK